jgi:hypothetical protein
MKRFSFFMALFMALVFAASVNAAYTVDQKWVRFPGTAGATLVTGDPVAVADADGEVYEADANVATRRPCIGIIAHKTGGDGETVEVVTYGIVGGLTGLTEGGAVYLSETAGEFTQSAPTYSQIVGYAISTTEIIFNPLAYFDTSSLTALGTLTGATPIIMEGASDDAHETTITPEDPTADNVFTIPDDTGTAITSTLSTNGQDVVNSVWGASDSIVAEGATADAYEGTLTWADPTADVTWTMPDDTGYIAYQPGGSTTSAGDSLAIPITHAVVTKTTGGDAEALTLADGEEGQILTITLGTDGGGNGTLTPSTSTGWATAVFADAGDTITVKYVDDSVGWILMSAYGLTAQPEITQ